jgi:hypothetical protein
VGGEVFDGFAMTYQTVTHTAGIMAITALIDSKGYILSTNQERLYCHNINTPDSVISEGLSKALFTVSRGGADFKQRRIKGKNWIIYTSVSAVGNTWNTFCIMTTLSTLFVHDYLTLFLITLGLLVLETVIFLRYRRGVLKLTEQVNRTSQIADAIIKTRYDVNLHTLRSIFKQDGHSTGKSREYCEIYDHVLKGSWGKQRRANSGIF